MLVWIFLGAGALALVGLATLFPDAMESEASRMGLVYYAGLMVLCAGGIAALFRQGAGTALKQLGAWCLIAVALLGLYAYKDELETVAMRIGGELVPSLAVRSGDGMVALHRSRDGHFYVDAEVEGVRVRMMIDTGASLAVLTADAASRIGLDPGALDYTVRVATANGQTWVAPVRLERVSVGGLTVEGVRAAVARPGELDVSLLGLSFLDRLSALEISGGRLTLRR